MKNVFKTTFCSAFFVSLIFFSTFSHAEIYKWIDENGKLHFADKPPAEHQVEKVEPSNINIIDAESTDSLRKGFKKDFFIMPARRSPNPARFVLTTEMKNDQPTESLLEVNINQANRTFFAYVKIMNADRFTKYIYKSRILDAKGELIFEKEESYTPTGSTFYYITKISPNPATDEPGKWTFQGLLNNRRLYEEKRNILFDKPIANKLKSEILDKVPTVTGGGARISKTNPNAKIDPNLKTGSKEWIKQVLRKRGRSTSVIDQIAKVKKLNCAPYSSAACQARYLENADYSYLPINNINFNDSNLKNAKFVEADIANRTSFVNSDLRFADFTGASIRNINFSGADLRGAIFKNIACNDCNFSGANLEGAILSGKKFRNINFEGANLTDIAIDSIGELQKINLLHTKGFNLIDSLFFNKLLLEKINVSDIKYTIDECDLGIDKVKCDEVNLSDHAFPSNHGKILDLQGSNLRGTDMSELNYRSYIFNGADLRESVLPRLSYNANPSLSIKGAKINDKTAFKNILPAILAKADLSECKKCQEIVSNNTINVDKLLGFLDDSPDFKKSEDLELWKFISLKEGTAIISPGDLRRLVKELLTRYRDNYELLKQVMEIISENKKSVDNVCLSEDVLATMRPYLSFKITRKDPIKTRGNTAIYYEANIREKAAECLQHYSTSSFPNLHDDFINALKIEQNAATRKTMLLGLRESMRDKALPILLEDLVNRDESISEQAAKILSTWNELPMEALPLLVELTDNDQQLALSKWYLLQSYGAKAQDIIPDLQDAYDKWELRIDDKNKARQEKSRLSRIQVLKDSARIVPLPRQTPKTFTKDDVLLASMPSEISISHLKLKPVEATLHLQEEPMHELWSVEGLKEYFRNIWMQISTYLNEDDAGQIELSTPVFTKNRQTIEQLANHHRVPFAYRDSIEAVALGQYRSKSPIYQRIDGDQYAYIGVDVFLIKDAATATNLGNEILRLRPSRRRLIQKDRMLIALWHSPSNSIDHRYFRFYIDLTRMPVKPAA